MRDKRTPRVVQICLATQHLERGRRVFLVAVTLLCVAMLLDQNTELAWWGELFLVCQRQSDESLQTLHQL